MLILKNLGLCLSPLDATLTKNRGEGGSIVPSSLLLAICAALLISPSAKAQEKSPPPHRVSRIEVYESSEELHETLQEKPALTFAAARAPQLTITVNDATKYQQIDGFGASLTDSSAWLISQKLSSSQRAQLLEMLFDRKKGIGLSMLRQPMGASDFALSDYSYDDMPPGGSDPELKHFTIDRDRQYILPVLREALAVNSKLKIIASPWSPPGWMKTSGSLIGGTLLPSSFTPLARYFVQQGGKRKFVAFVSEGMQTNNWPAATRKSPVPMTPGSPQAEVLPEIGVAESDLVVPRLHGLSPMHGTELDPILRNLGVRTIVAVGVSVNLALTNLVLDAVNAGYQVVVPRDAVAGLPPAYVEAVFEHTLGLVATITTAAEVVSLWEPTA